MKDNLTFIGHVKTPYEDIHECPDNTHLDRYLCVLSIDEKYRKGILGLEVSQNIFVLYWLDDADRETLTQCAPHHKINHPTGTFSLRSPHRPNPIGIAVVTIESIADNNIYVRGLDCLYGTKLLDIKPA